MFIYALVSKCLPRIFSVQIGVSARLCIWETLTGSTGCVNKGGGFLSVFGGSYFWSFISHVYSGLGEAFWTPRSPVFLSRLAFTPIMEGSFPRGEDLLALRGSPLGSMSFLNWCVFIILVFRPSSDPEIDLGVPALRMLGTGGTQHCRRFVSWQMYVTVMPLHIVSLVSIKAFFFMLFFLWGISSFSFSFSGQLNELFGVILKLWISGCQKQRSHQPQRESKERKMDVIAYEM